MELILLTLFFLTPTSCLRLASTQIESQNNAIRNTFQRLANNLEAKKISLPNSCQDNCGRFATGGENDDFRTCYCDAACSNSTDLNPQGTCCSDFCEKCPTVPRFNSAHCQAKDVDSEIASAIVSQCQTTTSHTYCGFDGVINFTAGACGYVAQLDITEDYEEVIVNTCGTWADKDWDTMVWTGYPNGTRICQKFEDEGLGCSSYSNRYYGRKDGYCTQSHPSQSTYFVGVDQEVYLGDNVSAFLRVECIKNSSSVAGDPKMTNTKGERFDIVREGLADLLVIRNGTQVLLKIQAMIKRILPSCKGRFECNFGLFTTEVTLSGSWTNRKFQFGIEKAQDKEQPSVLIDGAEAWPLSETNPIFSELTMRVSNFSSSDQGLRFDFMDTTLDIRRIVQNYKVCMNDNRVKFFNVYFRGAKELLNKGMTIGGILGHDPHDDWEKCDISDDKSDLSESWETEMKFDFAKVE